MNVIFDQIILFFQDLKTAPLLAQILTLAGIPALIGAPVWLMTRRVRASVTRYDQVAQALQTARREAKALEQEAEALRALTPERFLDDHAKGFSNGNEEAAMAVAERFLDRNRTALLLAARTRMEESIGQAVEDGPAGYAAAHRWAQMGLALAPSDRDWQALAAELAEAESIAAASGLSVKLQTPEARAERLAQTGRLPGDLVALNAAFFSARDTGHYRLMRVLADQGKILTRRAPFGPASREHMPVRRHGVEALRCCGELSDALVEAEELLPPFSEVWGPTEAETLYLRFLIADCHSFAGDAATALTEAEAVLPDWIEAHSADHQNVLATRYLIARCRTQTEDVATALTEAEALVRDQTKALTADHPHVLSTRQLVALCRLETGDAATALTEAETLSQDQTKALGAKHPEVLTTRHLIARCRLETADAATALAEAEALLPDRTQALGAEHPDVLNTLILVARCHVALGEHEEATQVIQGVRAGLRAAGLAPEHRYYRRLEEVEAAIGGA